MHLFAGMYVEMIGLGYSRQPRQQGAEVNFILFILARRQMGADASAVAFHDGFGDGKPDAVAAACPCAIPFYGNFNLDMDRSPGFGSAHADFTPY